MARHNTVVANYLLEPIVLFCLDCIRDKLGWARALHFCQGYESTRLLTFKLSVAPTSLSGICFIVAFYCNLNKVYGAAINAYTG